MEHGQKEQAAPDQQSQGDAADDRANTVPATRMKLHVCSEGGTSVAAKCEKSKRRIHECSVAADRYPQYLWGNMEIYQYQACMTEHGQQE